MNDREFLDWHMQAYLDRANEKEARMNKSPDLTSEMNIANLEGQLSRDELEKFRELRRQARSQGVAMKHRRPMTEAEEETVTQAIVWYEAHVADGFEVNSPEWRIAKAVLRVMEERRPKPMTPEERAVIEAAKGMIVGRVPGSALDIVAYNNLVEAVRRLG